MLFLLVAETGRRKIVKVLSKQIHLCITTMTLIEPAQKGNVASITT